jgi:hypothetical protein
LAAKDRVRTVDFIEPYYFCWQGRYMQFRWGERPGDLPGCRPPTKRQLDRRRISLARVSPLDQARRCLAELARPGVRTKAQVARTLEVSRVRVVQFLNLLKLDPRILKYLDTHWGDPVVRETFCERRLRDLQSSTLKAHQWKEFNSLLRQARSESGQEDVAS